MSDEEHHFESKVDARASKTYPQQAGTILKNNDSLLSQIKEGFGEGKDLLVSVMSAMGEEQISGLKDIGSKPEEPISRNRYFIVALLFAYALLFFKTFFMDFLFNVLEIYLNYLPTLMMHGDFKSTNKTNNNKKIPVNFSLSKFSSSRMYMLALIVPTNDNGSEFTIGVALLMVFPTQRIATRS
ncbi:hypothetical protein HHK36_029733 [Tetracentron sinense]|uniref:Translation initiation factor 5A C-terminal domain-containing protein n=1 Tax=Tetracentron sinense TaxID=13715 RepID=A0A834YBU3_TETSI|nr:hypothetical protein HHK36_029733 [Tetracentron sinense]